MMHAEQRACADAVLHSMGVRRAWFSDPASVTWLTGVAAPVQVGVNPFAGGPPLVWYTAGQFTLVIADSLTEAAKPTGCDVVSYPGYTYETPLPGLEVLPALMQSVMGAGTGAVGIETRHLPEFITTTLRQQGFSLAPIDQCLELLRRVKTAEELAKLRRSFALADTGQAAARQAIGAGAREIDVWAAVQSAIEREAGERVPLGNDCVVGYREDNSGGWPATYELRPGDSVIVDVGTRWQGYWSDGCVTYFVGEPSTKQKALYRTVSDALALAISLIRPGVAANEVDRQVRQFIAQAGYPVYAHHTGHSIGVTFHEAPRLVPYNTQLLEAGMVLMLEPGIYFPSETGVRLEEAVLVTPQGAQVLTHHDKSLPQ